MKKIGVICDTTSDLRPELLEELNIDLFPLQVNYSYKHFRDRVDITSDYVYEHLDEEIPMSSLPLTSDIIDILEKKKNEGYTHLIIITISSNLSGTYNAVKNALEHYKDDFQVELIDSKQISMSMSFSVIEAARIVKNENDFDKAVSRAKYILERSRGFFTVEDLKYLKKGGRIGSFEGVVGTLLDIKPIIGITEEGYYYPAAKVRGRKKSLNTITQIAFDLIKDKKRVMFSVIHGRAEKEAIEVFNILDSLKNSFYKDISVNGPLMAGHAGPGTLGICVAWED
ncbi:MAG: DegV family protein [Filifactoraceae bacterium]